MKKRSFLSLVLYLAVLALLFSWVTGLFGGSKSDVPYSKVVDLLEEGQVKSFVVDGQKIRLDLRLHSRAFHLHSNSKHPIY